MRFKRFIAALAVVTAMSGTGTAYADQTVTGSIGTVQATTPSVDVGGSVSAPASVDPTNASTAPTASVTVGTAPATGGSQSATNSIGTAQVGSGPQSSHGSVGTVQVTQPAIGGRASGTAPTSAGTSGASSDPDVAVSGSLAPATGGSQTAADSIGTAQIGGGGSQNASGSAGTVQVAQPGADANGTFTGPLRAGMPDGAVFEPNADTSLTMTPAAGGSQSADGSAGTVQVGGGGSQSATDSAGTVQAGVPSAAVTGGTTPGPGADADVTVTPTGGSQSADNSVGTVQLGGGGSSGGTEPTGSFLSTTGSPAATAAATTAASPATGPATTAGALPAGTQGVQELPARSQGLGVQTPLNIVRAVAQLPFTGLALWIFLIAALTLVLMGQAIRKAAPAA
jgi:hypothetical protein